MPASLSPAKPYTASDLSNLDLIGRPTIIGVLPVCPELLRFHVSEEGDQPSRRRPQAGRHRHRDQAMPGSGSNPRALISAPLSLCVSRTSALAQPSSVMNRR